MRATTTACLVAMLGLAGCELVVDFDRSRIGTDSGVLLDTGLVALDAGTETGDGGLEAGAPDGAAPQDSGARVDASFDAGPPLDAGLADGGRDAALADGGGDAGPSADAGP